MPEVPYCLMPCSSYIALHEIETCAVSDTATLPMYAYCVARLGCRQEPLAYSVPIRKGIGVLEEGIQALPAFLIVLL